MNDNLWERARDILCLRLDNMGDVLMTTPAMRALKHSLPKRRITLLASAGGAAGAAFMPEIDDVIMYAPPWIKSSDTADAGLDLAMVEQLRARQFDGAVIFTSYSQSPLPAAMLCHLAGIPLRLAHCRENPYHLLTHWVAEQEPQTMVRHEVRRQLDLVATIGCSTHDERLSFHVPDDDAAWARRHLQAIGIDLTRPWILMHPGASAPSRRYPPALWTDAANRLAAELRCPLVFTGGAEECALVESIREGLAHPSYSLAGKLDLGKFAAVVAQAPLLVSNNTGPAHIAAAVATPVIDLYALTNPQHTPWQVPNRVLYHDVPCGMCYKSICPQGHHDCLSKLSPARVAREAVALLHETWAGGPGGRKSWRRQPRTSDTVLQPLFEQRSAKQAKGTQLEPLTPVVIQSPPQMPDGVRQLGKRAGR
jgi:lipopolysaccharide heptosyltransferase II